MGKPKERGLGDTLENLINKLKIKKIVGVKDCKRCKARRDTLNNCVPYNNLMI